MWLYWEPCMNEFSIFFDFFTAYNFAIIYFTSKVSGTKILTSCKSHILQSK